MDCQKMKRDYEANMSALIAKYKDKGSSAEILRCMLIENTNFVMGSMLEECLALSRGAHP